MERVGVPFKESPAIEIGLYAAIRKGDEIEMESRQVIGSTYDTMRMNVLADTLQLLVRRFSSFDWSTEV